MYNNIVGGFRNTIGTNGADLTEAIVYDSIAIGDNLNMYAGRNSGMIGQALVGGSAATTIVGVANVDLTTSIINAFTASFNNYGPRFIVGTGVWNPQNNTGTRANGFVVMSDGASSFPSLTNGMIDTAGDDSAVTKGWVLAQTDVNTTYDLASAQNASDVDITLTGSDASVDTVKLVAGANIILTDNGTSEITIEASSNALSAERVQIEVKNTSGTTLLKGTPVYITGTVGASIRAQVAAADASSSATMPAIGVLAQDLINNEDGFAVTGGFLTNITTDPIDGLTPTENDTVYVKAGGGLTLTKPTGSDLIQNIAKVGKVSGGNSGSLVISSILRTNDVPNLTEGKIWVGTAANTAESTVVHLDETNSRVGVGTTSPAVTFHVQGSGTGIPGRTFARFENTSIDSAAAAQFYNGDGNYAFFQYSGSGYVIGEQFIVATQEDKPISFQTNSKTITGGSAPIIFSPGGYNNEKVRFAANGNVGIGTTSPDYKLDVAGDVRIEAASALNFGGTAAASSTWQLQTANSQADFQIGETQTGPRMYFEAGGNIGIGTTSPTEKLHVSDGYILSEGAGTTHGFELQRSGVDTYQIRHLDGGLTIFNSTDAQKEMTFNGTGFVGIGTSSPQAKLDVNGGVRVADYTATASVNNVGTFRYRSDANNSYVDMCMQTGPSSYAWVNIVQNNW